MNEESKNFPKNHEVSKINEQLTEARKILEEAYCFFQENPARIQFTKVVIGKPNYLLLALQQIASEPRYNFKVRYDDYFHIGYKFYIYIGEDYFDSIGEETFNC